MKTKNVRRKPFERRSFRLEWEECRNGEGRIYLFGVISFREYEEKRKRFETPSGCVSVFGERLSVTTYRSGCVEVCGGILGVSFDRAEKKGAASCD